MPKIYFEELFPELGCPKPTPSRMAVPHWYKSIERWYGVDETMERNEGRLGSIRACPAVNDSIFSGYTLYVPADVYIDATGDEIQYNYAPFTSGSRAEDAKFDYILRHESQVMSGYESSWDFHSQTMKWNPYWGIRTEEGYSTLFMHPVHRTDLPFYQVTAIVDTDSFPTRSPYAFFVRRGFKGIIHRGTPMFQIFPFKRDDWESEIVEPDSAGFHRTQQMIMSVFSSPYRKMFWKRKKFN